LHHSTQAAAVEDLASLVVLEVVARLEMAEMDQALILHGDLQLLRARMWAELIGTQAAAEDHQIIKPQDLAAQAAVRMVLQQARVEAVQRTLAVELAAVTLAVQVDPEL
jgi:hypothetical protein